VGVKILRRASMRDAAEKYERNTSGKSARTEVEVHRKEERERWYVITQPLNDGLLYSDLSILSDHPARDDALRDHQAGKHGENDQVNHHYHLCHCYHPDHHAHHPQNCQLVQYLNSQIKLSTRQVKDSLFNRFDLILYKNRLLLCLPVHFGSS